MKRPFIKKFLIIAISSLIITIGVKLHSVYQFPKVINWNHKQLQLIDDKTKNFSFAVLGDNRNSIDEFIQLMNSINSDDDTLFSIDLGDLVGNGEMRKYMLFIDQVKRFKKPLLTVIGNHDITNFRYYFTEENGRENYYNIFGNFYYSFAIGDAYFIVLDNADEQNIDIQQMTWLQEELEKSSAYKYRFVFMHVPLFDPRVRPPEVGHAMYNINSAKQLNSIFDKYNITMLFTSHIHSYYRGEWGKTPYIITGGAGAPLYGKTPEHSFYHSIKVSVSGKGIMYEVKKITPFQNSIVNRFIDHIHDAWEYIYYFIVFQYLYIMFCIIILYVFVYSLFLKKYRKN
jgi:hypothetical protein